ncbi:MAG: hypothetical protein L6R36_009512, partial [Xanthoria steineri]
GSFRFVQPAIARASIPGTLPDLPFPIRSQPPPPHPRSSSQSSASRTSSAASKRRIEVVDLLSSEEDESEDDDPVTPKRLRTVAKHEPAPEPALEPAPEEPAPEPVPEAASPWRQLQAPLSSPYASSPSPSSSSSSTAARFRAVEVPVKRPFAVIPKSPAAAAQRQLFERNLRELKGPKITVVNEIDESSPSTDFRFVQESILQPGVEHVAEDFMVGCNCYIDNGRQIGCEYLYCECLDDSQINDLGKRVFPYGAGKKDFHCLRNFYLESRNHIYECNKKCNCLSNCKNRNVQHGRKVELEIFKTKNRGW